MRYFRELRAIELAIGWESVIPVRKCHLRTYLRSIQAEIKRNEKREEHQLEIQDELGGNRMRACSNAVP